MLNNPKYEWVKKGELYTVEWIGKLGDVNLYPTNDNGYFDQPAACRLILDQLCDPVD